MHVAIPQCVLAAKAEFSLRNACGGFPLLNNLRMRMQRAAAEYFVSYCRRYHLRTQCR